MIPDSSTISWNQAGKELIGVAQTNDFRMFFIMPYTFQQLGDVTDKKILDIGCGEGGYSRALAHKRARVTSVDCANNLIDYAIQKANEEGLKINHFVRNSNNLYGIEDNTFDIVLCSMMLMDCEDLFGTVKEIARVLLPGGRLFVSILHPCFTGKNIRWISGDDETKVLVEDYFSPQEWEATIAGMSSPVIFRHRTLHEYVKVFVQIWVGFAHIRFPAFLECNCELDLSRQKRRLTHLAQHKFPTAFVRSRLWSWVGCLKPFRTTLVGWHALYRDNHAPCPGEGEFLEQSCSDAIG